MATRIEISRPAGSAATSAQKIELGGGEARPSGAFEAFGLPSISASRQVSQEMEQARKARIIAKTQALQSILGNFDGSKGLDDAVMLGDLTRSDKLSEQRRKFLAEYPTGDFVSVPLPGGDRQIVFRRTKSDAFHPLKAMSRGDIPEIAEMASGLLSEPSAGAAVGAVVGSSLGPLGTAGGAAIGNAVGLGVQSLIESGRGFEDTSVGEVAVQAATDAPIVAGAELVIPGARAALQKLRGGTIAATIGLVPRARRIAQAASEEGLEGLATGQLAESTLTRGIFFQAGNTSPIVQRKVTAQQESLQRRLAELANEPGALDALSDADLAAMVAEQNQALGPLLTRATVAREEGFDALRKGLQVWDEASSRLVNRAYNRAISASDDVFFDTSIAKEVAKDVRSGRPVAQAAGPPQQVAELPETINRAVDIIDGLPDVLSKLQFQGKEFTAFEQLKSLRSELFDLRSNEDGPTRRAAERLWQSLKKVMDNPVSGDPSFVEKYRTASALYANKESIKEQAVMVKALNEDISPEDFASRFFRPGAPQKLKFLMDLTPLPQQKVFKEAFITDVLAEGQRSGGGGRAILSRLDAYRSDPTSLRILMDEATENEVRTMAGKLRDYESGFIRRTLESDSLTAERAVELARMSPGELGAVIRQSGGKGAETARAARAGIYKKILDRVTEENIDGTGPVVSVGKLKSEIESVRNSADLSPIFRPEDLRRLENFHLYTLAVGRRGDVGGPMQAGSVRSSITNFLNPAAQFSAAHTIIKNSLIARILASDVGADALRSPGLAPSDRVKAMIAALVVTQREMERARSSDQGGSRRETP